MIKAKGIKQRAQGIYLAPMFLILRRTHVNRARATYLNLRGET